MDELKAVAFHEAGHMVAAWQFGLELVSDCIEPGVTGRRITVGSRVWTRAVKRLGGALG